MPSILHNFSNTIHQLSENLLALEGETKQLDLTGLAGREWFEILQRKLIPQLSDNVYLVVGVVGGTNIGKSVIFNHLVNQQTSAISPLASQTKHPVCLVPQNFEQKHDLEKIFQGFKLTPWSAPEDPLIEDEQHLLFWKNSESLAPNLLVLDTPDIDSDAEVNWERAERIRQSADVLVTVLTQQKYNDAAVKKFFREAAREEKVIITIFNQCQLPDDENYWRLWLNTFCQETGVHPELVFIAPNDRQAATSLQLPFYPRTFEPTPSHSIPETDLDTADTDTSANLMNVISQLHFGEIKVQTLKGALKYLVQQNTGVPAYLREIKSRSHEFRSASELLSEQELAEIDNWPLVSNSVIVDAVRNWWQSQREGWSAQIHGFYNTLGRGVLWPVRYIHSLAAEEKRPPMELYREQEWSVVLQTVEGIYDRLTLVSELGNELLTNRLKTLLNGTSREALLKTLHEEHAEIDFTAQLEQLVDSEMTFFRTESPQYYTFMKQLDRIAAVARPALSVGLFFVGFGAVGHAGSQLVTDTMIQSVVNVAGDVAGGAATTTVGETAVSSTTATGVGFLEAKFRRFHAVFAQKRTEWLATAIRKHLLKSLPEELKSAVELPNSQYYQAVQNSVSELEQQLNELHISI
ncbi:MAG: 50S ribosome-binding GTPase [Planctomycetes bacterium]|nr:50S ribosome-binding GTPase [Planctomycetota bacterium]MCH9724455.1 50S ribosome-binding GTPase [Planctomycetota bacterium]MCH9778197.1 50S ribosome-binding GTPase [Planctomycetota bacterium]